jgi:hypothetical protein
MISERKKIVSDQGQFHYAITDAQFHGSLPKKIFNPLESTQTMASEYLFGIVKRSLETSDHFVHHLFYIQEIQGRVLTVG